MPFSRLPPYPNNLREYLLSPNDSLSKNLSNFLTRIETVIQLHFLQLSNNSFCLFAGSFLALLGVDRLEHLGYNFSFGTRNNREHVAVEMDSAALVFGIITTRAVTEFC